jgi:hypothetical protein
MVKLQYASAGGWWAKMNRVPWADHRSTLLAPPALLSVEVLTFGLLGEFGPEILVNRLGVVQVQHPGVMWEMEMGCIPENLDVTECLSFTFS